MNDIGSLGEKLTVKWLELQNYNLLEHNWRCRWGEIDIIAQDRSDRTIAFVEVKTRSKNNWDENGLLAVNATKQKKIIKTASMFLAKHPHLAELPCRFDVALVSYKKFPTLRREVAEKRETKKIGAITQLNIGQPIIIEQYQISIENHIQSAFELF